MSDGAPKKEVVLQGIAASPGVAHGPSFVFLQKELEIPLYQVDEVNRASEIKRFEAALMDTRGQISKVRQEVAAKLGEAEAQIFDAHLLVLDDRALIEETIEEQKETGFNIEYCFHAVAKRYIEAFGNIDDEYIKERVTDIRDVTKRLLQTLMGQSGSSLNRIGGPKVVVSEDLAPSDTASIEKGSVLAIVTDAGSRTSHAVIMARSLQVPAVVGLHDVTQKVENNETLLVDGYDGLVIINPSEQTLFRYGRIQQKRQTIQRVFEGVLALPSQTLDGRPFKLVANIAGPEDIEGVLKNGGEGVGLFRMEGVFIKGDKFPPEEEQFQIYRQVVESLKPRPVVIRTLDLGGDKRVSGLYFVENEANPFMGFRAIRFCLEHKELFKDQLRAILRASAFGKVRIMYPMISGVQELTQANQVLQEAKQELRARQQDFDPTVEIGSMIEIPSAAATADLLAEHCQFFSIGTNDLIQYMLAVDRVNDRIAHLYEPTHPAILRTIRSITETAKARNIKVSVCGEMAGDPLYVPLLLGLGADELSMAASILPEVKFFLRNIKMSEAEELAREALREAEPKVTYNRLRRFYNERMESVLKQHGA